MAFLWVFATKSDLNKLEKRIMTAEQAIAALKEAQNKQKETNDEVRAKLKEQSDRIKKLEDAAQNVELPTELSDAIAAVVEGDKALADIIPGTPGGSGDGGQQP